MKAAFRLTSLVAALLAIPPMLAACAVSIDSQAQVVRDEKRFTVSGRPELHLTTFDGAIEIQSWDQPDVLVEIEKRGPTREAVEALEIITSQDRDRITLEVKQPRSEGFGFHHSASAKLRVSLPRKADIVARSGDGSIRVDRVTGRLELRTGDGSIRAEDVSGDLTMNTGDGSVTVEAAEGRLTVDTGDGGVDVSGRLSALKLHTGDGSITYRAERESRMSEDWEVTTGDGSVTLYLPGGFSANIDAHTGDGTISNDLDVSRNDAEDGDDESKRRTLKGRLGDGGKTLKVRTGDGSIRFRTN